MNKIEELLIKHEGLRLTMYYCPSGKASIGVGRNITDKGITEKEAFYLLRNDIKECERDLANIIFKGRFYEFPEAIRLVLLSMRFQLGYTGFRNFKKMIIAFKAQDYQEAAAQMKDSNWYKQVPNRAKELIKMVEVM
ncbi:glycoside hydrolase family protein [candidate division KSB1 bacterium]|nr:glycoside hydrolase family protein [candidate division KSB1 bacterium]